MSVGTEVKVAEDEGQAQEEEEERVLALNLPSCGKTMPALNVAALTTRNGIALT